MSGVPAVTDKAAMEIDKTPNVGTAFLLLSHAGYLGVSMASLAFSAFVDNVGLNHPTKRSSNDKIAIAAAVLSAALAVWTLFALITTWISNTKVKNAVFGHGGFITVMLITLLVLTISLWWIYTIS